MGAYWIIMNGIPVIRCQDLQQAEFGLQLCQTLKPEHKWYFECRQTNGKELYNYEEVES